MCGGGAGKGRCGTMWQVRMRVVMRNKTRQRASMPREFYGSFAKRAMVGSFDGESQTNRGSEPEMLNRQRDDESVQPAPLNQRHDIKTHAGGRVAQATRRWNIARAASVRAVNRRWSQLPRGGRRGSNRR